MVSGANAPAENGNGREKKTERADAGETFSTLTFWYHLGFADLSEMPMAAIQAYVRDLPKHKAALQRMYLEAAAFPYQNEQGRAAMLQSLDNAQGVTETSAAAYALNPETGTFEKMTDGK